MHAAENEAAPATAREALAESAFRATRDGVQAEVWDGGRIRPLGEIAKEAVERAKPYVGDGVEDVLRIVREGNGADAQRAAFEHGGMDEVLADLVAKTVA
jgi:carboxylate-amine ligase